MIDLRGLWYKMYIDDIDVNHIDLIREGNKIKVDYDTREKDSKYGSFLS